MAVSHAVRELLEDILRLVLCQMFTLLDQVVKVTASSVLHDHHDVVLVFEDLVESNDVRMPDLLQDVHFLEDFLARILIFEATSLNDLDGDKLTRQLVYGQVHLAEGSFADFLDELVVVKARGRELLVLAHVPPVVLDELITVFADLLVKLQQTVLLDMALLLVDRAYSRTAGRTLLSVVRMLVLLGLSTSIAECLVVRLCGALTTTRMIIVGLGVRVRD